MVLEDTARAMTASASAMLSPVVDQDRSRDFGRQRRNEVPRRDHGDWTPSPDRPDPIAIIEKQAQSRNPEYIPLRHGRMAATPFTFYRGGAAIMAADLATMPSSGIIVHCCGDAHLSNFGVYATAERRLVFDLNDFDEAHHAPFEWDVKRLAASLVIAARDIGISDKDARIAARASVRRYREEMIVYGTMGYLDVWYSRLDVEAVMQLMQNQMRRRVEKNFVARVERKTNLGALAKLTQVVDGRLQIRENPPLIVRPQRDDLHYVLEEGLRDYRETLLPYRRELLDLYTPRDFAIKVVGVGSVGLDAYMWLFTGKNDNDPLFLQIKQAQASVLAPYNPPTIHEHQGRRVVFGQRILQAGSDQFLGWATGAVAGKHIYIRQLQDMKGSVDIAALNPSSLTFYATICGWALARAHARTGMAEAIGGYLGGGDAFDRSIEEFAVVYADQNQKDHAAMVEAIETGRIPSVELI